MTPIVIYGRPSSKVIFDDEFHDSVRRVVALREQLKLKAEHLAEQRGHILTKWMSFGLDHWETSCSQCGAGVKVETVWPDATGSATGTALTTDCTPPV
jgi:hypothetical protein